MQKEITLYARGIMSGWNGNNIQNSQSWADANMSQDTSVMSSLVVDGQASGFICGFGSVFMNGAFVRPYSFDLVPNLGWLGSYTSDQFNSIVGALRHLRIMMDYTLNSVRGSSILVIGDGGHSIDSTTDTYAWGQLFRYLKKVNQHEYLVHNYSDIQNGAYGYDGTGDYFTQFSSVILCLSANSQTMSAGLCNAIREGIKKGTSFIVLQKGGGEGVYNFNAIFNGLGINTPKSTYVCASQNSRNQSVNVYGNHIGWQSVYDLHIKEAVRTAQGYTSSDIGTGHTGNIGGQGGDWIPIHRSTVDVPVEDTIIDTPVVFNPNGCCIDIGGAFGTQFNIESYPSKPDDWQNGLAAGYQTISYSPDTNQSLEARSVIYCRAVGFAANTNGYTTINGQTFGDSRSYNIYVIDKNSRLLVDQRHFDVHGGGQDSAEGIANATACANFLNSIANDKWILVNCYDEPQYNHMAGGLPDALYRIGASSQIFNENIVYRSAFNLLGSPSLAQGGAIMELYKGNESNDPTSHFAVGYNFDRYGNPYSAGANGIYNDNPMALAVTGIQNNGKTASLDYFKIQDIYDQDKYYGSKFTVTYRDTRFKKLPMFQTLQPVVSVQNPCHAPPALVQSHDWVHVVNRANNPIVYYPFTDLKEYLITTTDGSGQNELCTSHLMMNYDMAAGTGNAVIYNSAGASHKIYCGSNTNNINDPNSLYIRTTEEGKVWHIYERPYKLTDAEVTRNTNDWQVWWKWGGVGTQGHNIRVEAGYEYIVFAYDRYGSIELAERHIILPKAENLPKWGSNFYTRDFSNSTTFTIDRNFNLNAYCEKSDDHGPENGIMMIIRRPLFETTGAEDRTGWQLVMDNNGTAIPRGTNYALTCEKNYQYMVLCSVGDGAFSTHHFNAWNGAFDAVWEGLFEADSGGRASWTAGLVTLMQRGNSGGLTMDSFLSVTNGSPVGVYQVYRRPILCWEPDEIGF